MGLTMDDFENTRQPSVSQNAQGASPRRLSTQERIRQERLAREAAAGADGLAGEAGAAGSPRRAGFQQQPAGAAWQQSAGTAQRQQQQQQQQRQQPAGLTQQRQLSSLPELRPVQLEPQSRQQAQSGDPFQAQTPSQSFEDAFFAPSRSVDDFGGFSMPGGQDAAAVQDAGGGKKKRNKWNVVFYVSLVVFIAALVALGAIVGMYLKGRSANDGIAEAAGATSDFEAVSLADMTVDWDALRAINPDIVGWIYMPGTVINYPVVQTTDNDKYLTLDFEGNPGTIVNFGTIFLDYNNESDFTDRNNVIYGHHMNDGSMFAPIAKLEDEGEFNSHRVVYLLSPTGNFRLTTFSLMHIPATELIVQTKFGGDDAYQQYIQDKIDRSVVTPSGTIPQASEIKKSFAFSTCDNAITSDGRYVLFCYVAESTSDYITGLDAQDSALNGALQGTKGAIDAAAGAAAGTKAGDAKSDETDEAEPEGEASETEGQR